MSPQQAVARDPGTADTVVADTRRSPPRTLYPRVLVVEDDAWLAIELERLLDELDCEVCTVVNNAPVALVAAAVHQPDLVLLDLSGSSAQEITKQIHHDLAIPTLCLRDMVQPCSSTRFRNDLKSVLERVRRPGVPTYADRDATLS
jgi:CheY-like chemotaxis protein